MKAPELANEPEVLREVCAIRLKIYEERKRLKSEIAYRD
jgi:hypothetical protein